MIRKICMFAVLVVLLAGCTRPMVVNIDGMPIPNYEYVSTDKETGLRVNYLLARYYKKYEGKEYLIVPQYLKAWDDQEIDASNTEELVLHVKVINLKRVKYTAWYEYTSDAGKSSHTILYHGQLSRKDFRVTLPVVAGAKAKYRLAFVKPAGEEIYEIGFPYFSYSVKGGSNVVNHN
jgi:hypothetical protein